MGPSWGQLGPLWGVLGGFDGVQKGLRRRLRPKLGPRGKFGPNLVLFGTSLGGHFGGSSRSFVGVILKPCGWLRISMLSYKITSIHMFSSSARAGFREATGIRRAPLCGSLAAFRSPPRLVQAGTKVDRRCRRHRRSNSREPKVPLWAPKKRRAENTVTYSVLAPNVAKTLALDRGGLVPPTRAHFRLKTS